MTEGARSEPTAEAEWDDGAMEAFAAKLKERPDHDEMVIRGTLLMRPEPEVRAALEALDALFERLVADAERLDWMEANRAETESPEAFPDHRWRVWFDDEHEIPAGRGANLREAIDAARTQEPPCYCDGDKPHEWNNACPKHGTVAEPTSCTWTEDESGVWETACKEAFVFNDGTPAENDAVFCMYCGQRIVEVRYDEAVD